MSDINGRIKRLSKRLGASGVPPWEGVDGRRRALDAAILDVAVSSILAGDEDEGFTAEYVAELGIEPYDDDEAIVRKAMEHARVDLGLTPAELDELRRWIDAKPGDRSVAVEGDECPS